jgi:RND family efflux transporter MFP subunit
MSRTVIHIALVVVALTVGLLGAALLAFSRTPPERTERPALGPLVEVVSVTTEDRQVTVKGNGQVVPERAVTVIPQVAGTIIETHPALVSGGFFAKGEPLVTIDPRDYELAVQRAEAVVARAQVRIEQEQAEAAVAREEWEALNPGEAPASGLVVREPQIRQAEAELASARADLESARLNLERTRVTVPFDGVVVSKSVDLGQFITMGSPVATVYGTAVAEVRIPLESRELAWIDVPNAGRGGGSSARVSTEFAGARHEWPGTVDRIEAEVDRSSRMVTVVVRVDRPYSATDGRPPLLPGTFADVEIDGTRVEQVVAIPRRALHADDTVWVVEDGILTIRPVTVARTDRLQVLVTDGLASGDRVVVSALDAVTDGMVVRPVDADGGAA